MKPMSVVGDVIPREADLARSRTSPQSLAWWNIRAGLPLSSKDASRASVEPIVTERVLPEALVYTDEWTGYDGLTKRGYLHSRVQHAEKVYVVGNVHTNTIEGFWSLLKRGISGVYHSVSATHLQAYIDEYAFRYNHRDDDQPMFAAMSGRLTDVRAGQYGQYNPVGAD